MTIDDDKFSLAHDYWAYSTKRVIDSKEIFVVYGPLGCAQAWVDVLVLENIHDKTEFLKAEMMAWKEGIIYAATGKFEAVASNA